MLSSTCCESSYQYDSVLIFRIRTLSAEVELERVPVARSQVSGSTGMYCAVMKILFLLC
jgi:hypothetical protein